MSRGGPVALEHEGDLTPVDLVRRDTGYVSVQRLDARAETSMSELADQYFDWLGRAFRGLVRVRGRAADDAVVMRLAGVPAIRLRRVGVDEDALRFEVVGGALARSGGSFSFVRHRGGAQVILEGFLPRLPAWLYARTHGPVHVQTMNRFAAHLRRLATISNEEMPAEERQTP